MKGNPSNSRPASFKLAIAGCLYLFLNTIATSQEMTPNEIIYGKNRGGDPFADLEAFPTAPEGFEVTLVAKEPLVRNACAIAFDGLGRMCNRCCRLKGVCRVLARRLVLNKTPQSHFCCLCILY